MTTALSKVNIVNSTLKSIYESVLIAENISILVFNRQNIRKTDQVHGLFELEATPICM